MHLSTLRLGVVGVACAMVVGMPSVAIGGVIALATGPDQTADGYLRIVPDDYGAWSSTTFGGGGDLFNPTGPLGPLEAAFSSGFFLFVPGLMQRELLTDNVQWLNIGGIGNDVSLDSVVTFGLVPSDTNGDGVPDTAISSFSVTGLDTDLTFDLEQKVRVSASGVSYVQQDYTITNNSNLAINFAMVRAFDGDLVWNAGFENDEVGTSMHGAGLGPYVFEQEASDPGITAITLSSLMGGDYYGGKNGVTPEGGPPAYGFGTDVQVWDAFGLPTSWRSHIAGVGYNANGVSGQFPPGSIPPEDGAIGLDIPLSLGPGASTTFRVVHTYGQNIPAIVGDSVTLAPLLALNPLGTQHTVTATVVDDLGDPIQGRLVSFVVLFGPNAGAIGDDFTDVNGEATFTYTGDGGSGVDDIEASFVDGLGQTQFSNIVQKFWDVDCNANGIVDTCDISCAGFGGACSILPGCGGSADVDLDGIPDECEPDCNGNGVPDHHDIFLGTSLDVDLDGIPDECEPDCNGNGVPDHHDIFLGTSLDVNGNGIPDECEPDCNGNGVPDDHDIFLGTSLDLNGNGIPDECEAIEDFEDPQEFPADGEPSIEAVGDLDGDGTDDVVTAIPGVDPLVNGAVQVFLNQGTDMAGQWLGFVPNTPVTVGREPSGVAVGLFNADPFVDVAVTNAGDNTVSILFNQGTGDGSLFPPVDIIVGNRPSAIIAADFNLDSFVDLAVTNQLDSNVMLLLNDGTGNFPPPPPPGGGGGAAAGFPTFPSGGEGFSLVTDDFDGNKRPDMAGTARTAGFAGPTGLVFVLLGQGDGTFDPVAVHTIGLDPLDLATSDLQRDGAVDIVAVNSGDGTVSILLNQLDGTFGPASTLPVGLNPRSIDAVDLNGEGDSDLAVVADDPVIGPSVQVLANRIDLGGGLVFDDPVAFSISADPGADPNFVVSADLNNDAIFDLVTVNANVDPTTGSVTALLADPITVSCPWDCQAVHSGAVDVPDLLALLGAWGGPQTPGTTCDFDGSGFIAVPDLLKLLANWGPCL